MKNFIKKYAQSAYNVALRYGLPFDVILTQAGLESGWGINAYGFNFFGIKANSAWHGQRQLLWTREYNPKTKQYERVQSWFRKYASAEESFEDYGKFITSNARYRTAVETYKLNGDSVQYINNIANAGYATAPNYAASLIATLKNVLAILAGISLKKK